MVSRGLWLGPNKDSAWLARHECCVWHRRPRHPPASIGDVVRYREAGTSVAHLLPDRKDLGCVLRWPDIPTMPIMGCHRVRSSDPSYSLSMRQMSSEIALGRGVRIHVYADDTQIYVSCAASGRQPAATRLGCLRIGNRILDEIKSAETDCLENRIHLDWHSAATLQGRGRSPDGLWAISNVDGKSTGSRCLRRQGADNGGSREQYCTWLHVSTPPTSQRQAVADPRQPARTPHNICC